MSKAIKVIDLLNKIANGEEVPERIKHYQTYYTWYDNGYSKGYCKEPVMADGNSFLEINTKYDLLREVEIIEEEPEIDIQSIEGIDVEVISQCDNWLQNKNEEITAEINPYIIDCIRKNTLNFYNKINESIKAIKQLDNQINNK